jgi:hypothetical protein
MITVALIGGLGNQLFKIFATIAYALEYNHSFVFPYSTVLKAGIDRPTYWDSFLKSLKIYTTANIENNIKNEDLNNFTRIYNLDHHYVELPIPDKNINYMITGYCQSYKYFDKYKHHILNMINFKKIVNLIKNKYSDILEYDIHTTYTIGMHFRVGDYKYLQHSHHLLKYQYYENALNYILNVKSNDLINKQPIVYYFVEHDDINHANQIISRLQQKWNNVDFILIDSTISDWKQMLIMSCFQSIIIANSTFSWWAAYFNENPDIICYPNIWFGPRLEANILNDMFPAKWIKVDE